MSDGYPKAGYLLTEAADHIAAAARIIVAESAKAESLTNDPMRDHNWQQLASPPLSSLSTQALTEIATKLGGHANEIRMHGAWLSQESE